MVFIVNYSYTYKELFSREEETSLIKKAHGNCNLKLERESLS